MAAYAYTAINAEGFELTGELKREEASRGIALLMRAAEWLPAGALALGASLVRGPVNMIVTNVPGPQFRLYSVGAPLLGLYPMVPLIPGGGLGIALFGYEGKLCWGFTADWDLVPDLHDLVDAVQDAFRELQDVAAPQDATAHAAAAAARKSARAARPRGNGAPAHP